MPAKDPNNFYILWDALPASIRAAIVGFAVAFLRVMYDGREPSLVRRLLESLLCGAISLCVASLAQASGVSGDYSTFVGGAVGLLGADQVRTWARKRVKELK